ncbi:hypothetical protein EV426DRAFT_270502 [Tirmania nivea]|nr:hypothetical protein EV426DRAFT_270502 [Tirmania nivea]
MGFLVFLVIYIFGGLTFLPLLAVASFTYFYHTAPVVHKQESLITSADEATGIVKTIDEKTLDRLKSEQDDAAGYFAVTREWTPGGINGKPPERITPMGATSIKGEEPSQSMYQTVVGSIFNRKGNGGKGDANGAPKKKRAANVFYVVLRHGHLMLYDDSEQLQVRHVISLSHHNVSIYGGGEKIPEGELYIRRNAICLTRREVDPALKHDFASLSKPFYLFSENCSEKEDFYFALLRCQERASEDDPTIEPPPPSLLGFDPANLRLLVQTLYSSEEQYQTKWINAILGRLFLALYKTPDLEKFFKNKIDKKIARVKKPTFLSDVVIQKVDVGESAPFITNPKLRELMVNGETIVEANVSYAGGFNIEIFTTARVDLGTRFKAREVDLRLAAVLKKLEGKILVRIKPPPSNRIWVSFETMPKMELNIEPIISQRSITYGPILRLIENRVREVIEETLVYPHFDDLPFTDTINQTYRGGIWRQPKPETSASQPAISTEEIDTGSAIDESVTGSPSDAKSLSMPNLTSLSSDGKKQAYSSISVTDMSSDTSSGLTHRARRKPKSMRTSSFTQLTAPQPLVSTEAVNVTAVRVTTHTETEKGAAKSQVKATIDRSRSASMSSSPRGTPVGSPSNPISPLPSAGTSNLSIGEEGESQDEFHLAMEGPTSTEQRPPARHSRSQSLSTTSSSTTPVPSTPPNIYGGGSRTFTNSSISPMGSRTNTNLSIALSQQNPSPGAKPTINNAINKGVAVVTRWYKGRTETNANNNTPTSPTSIEGFLRNSTQPQNNSTSQLQHAPAIHVHHSPNYILPPPEFPPPPAKRTAPIAVPKRRPLAPPLLPARNNGNNNNSNKPAVDDVMVVAAPPAEPEEDSSEPSTPPDEFMVSLDGNTIHHHQNSSSGLAGLLRGDRDRPPVPRRQSSNSASASSGGSVGAWDVGKHQRQRGGSRSGETVGIGNFSLKGKTSPGRTRGSSGSGLGTHLGSGMMEDEIPWNEAKEAELKGKAGW